MLQNWWRAGDGRCRVGSAGIPHAFAYFFRNLDFREATFWQILNGSRAVWRGFRARVGPGADWETRGGTRSRRLRTLPNRAESTQFVLSLMRKKNHQKILKNKNFRSKKLFVEKMLGSKKIDRKKTLVEKILADKNLIEKKWSKKNRGSTSLDIVILRFFGDFFCGAPGIFWLRGRK